MFLATHITPPDQIFKELTEIQAFLEGRYSSDNPAACVDRLDELQVYMARTGKLLADAGWHYDKLLTSAIMDAVKMATKNDMSISITNKYIESICREYKYLVTWSSRLNAATVHASDGVRTIISKHKAEMNFR